MGIDIYLHWQGQTEEETGGEEARGLFSSLSKELANIEKK